MRKEIIAEIKRIYNTRKRVAHEMPVNNTNAYILGSLEGLRLAADIINEVFDKYEKQ